MSRPERLRVIAAAPDAQAGPDGMFGPDDPRAEVWLPQLGPSAWLLWRVLARRLGDSGTRHGTLTRPLDRSEVDVAGDMPTRGAVVEITVEELSATLGLGSPDGSQARVRRAVRRLNRWRLLLVNDDLWTLQTRLPLLSPVQAARLPPSLRATHDRARAADLAC
jgi:hypothetical protein